MHFVRAARARRQVLGAVQLARGFSTKTAPVLPELPPGGAGGVGGAGADPSQSDPETKGAPGSSSATISCSESGQELTVKVDRQRTSKR